MHDIDEANPQPQISGHDLFLIAKFALIHAPWTIVSTAGHRLGSSASAGRKALSFKEDVLRSITRKYV